MWNNFIDFDKNWLYAWNNFANSSKFWQVFFKLWAEWLIYLVPIILIGLWFYSQPAKKVALRAAFSGLIAWLILAKIIGEIINRPRPFQESKVQELFFHRPSYSFPSDHSAFLFAVAFSFWLSGYKKLANFSFIIALIISVARVFAGIHYPSDIIAGAILGIIAAFLVWLFDRPLNYLYNFLLVLARRIKLG